ncbi:YcnI family protein [Cohnella sp. CFH 77786]|uniref:YcnI family protein n=1 Tax=Cohnella sp. CFH 77786 TaxID=2662265 RepID=UPI00351CD630
MKKSVITVFVLLFSLAFGGIASAHVTVQPKEVPANSYQVFTLRVPTEKEVATTQVKVEVPDGVNVSRFEPKPDWTYELEKNADGKITAVTWKTTGPGFGPTEFGQFNFQGKVAEDAKELVWKAHQTYADGSVVDWTGPADADTPASVTKVTAAAGGNDGHGAASGSAASADGANNGDNDTLTLSLAIAGLAAGVLSLVVSLVRKRA